MEINAPGIVVGATPYGEGDALVSVFTEAEGIYRGLARGGSAKAHASLWQIGNLVQSRWVARLQDQLGRFSGELIHAGAALAMDDAWSLRLLSALCAVVESGLPERQPLARIFRGVLHLVVHSRQGLSLVPELVRWELNVLQESGWGLDLSACAVSGARTGLAFVSPRTGRAVCADSAGLWKERLLPLPRFLSEDDPGNLADWADGLRLTGHFMARDVFGLRNRPLPSARTMLEEKIWEAARSQDVGQALTAPNGEQRYGVPD